MRARNFLAVLVQVGAIAAVASLLWMVAGYRLAFGDVGGGIIGGGGAWLFQNPPPVRAGLTLPENVFALFQMCFAAITPALMAGAWVDRTRFSWVIAFCALWGPRGLCAGRALAAGRRLAGEQAGRARFCGRHRRPHDGGRLRAGRGRSWWAQDRASRAPSCCRTARR